MTCLISYQHRHYITTNISEMFLKLIFRIKNVPKMVLEYYFILLEIKAWNTNSSEPVIPLKTKNSLNLKVYTPETFIIRMIFIFKTRMNHKPNTFKNRDIIGIMLISVEYKYFIFHSFINE